ncbi:hypothetical protein [Pseudochrobactrum sp. MP213Fo]|uniref:hypothetical protein n=1 Tax=Pseudochrobactrum sp. MP213Fo TaxID=3022250 RepID=UPI003BA3B5CC
MIKIDVRGMSLFGDDDGRAPFTLLALAEVYVPDLGMTIKNVRLVWSEQHGYRAISPLPWKGQPSPVLWYHGSDFAIEMLDQILDMFERMGGKLPAPRPAPRPVTRRDHVTGKPINADPFETLGRLDIADKMPDDALEQAAIAVAHARRHAAAMADNDTSGLRRTLKVCPAIDEAMQEAGL